MRRAPDWYKDAIVYELHVRAFADSGGDGIGDFDGLRRRLDYLHDLGVTCLWLLPFYPSPLRDDGYDIADYAGVNPDYGTLASFQRFLREAHERELRVITELVVNHTSDQHPWFQRARRAPKGSRHRDYYVWSDTDDRYRDARIIFGDYETSNWAWDSEAGAYYWHRFYSHQPDLNFEHADVRRAVVRALDTWLRMGVDGLRLDAVPYLFEAEGTSCENLPATHEFLKELRAHVDEHFADRLLLAEANQWPEDARQYFGDGDECHMAFHFPLMPRLFMGLRMEDRFPIVDILAQTPQIPESCQWALFLRNHDELTLEMVTDEERDYMYRTYAHEPAMRVNLGIRRRLAPLLQNHRQKIELMHGLLCSLPGTPVLYYGDEIGMGDNVYLGDRDSVRTPMQWSADRNAGFSTANPQRLYLPTVIDPEYHYETVNVEAQHHNPQSLLWWVRRLLALRKRYRVFGRGRLEMLAPDNPSVLAFVRRDEDSQVLVVANLSRFAQFAELDLGEYRGMTPIELFGRTEFPLVGELPYLVTLGPYAFYWLELTDARARPDDDAPIELRTDGAWPTLLERPAVLQLERALPQLLRTRRWFGAKNRRISRTRIDDVTAVDGAAGPVMTVVHVEYADGEADRYLLPMGFVGDPDADWLHDQPQAVLARVRGAEGGDGWLIDAHWDHDYARALLGTMRRRRRLGGRTGSIVGHTSGTLATIDPADPDLSINVGGAEQSNTSILFGDRLVMKTFRRIDTGVNPELELGSFLTRQRFAGVPAVAGDLEYRAPVDPGARAGSAGGGAAIAVLHDFVANEGDAYTYTVRSLGRFFDAVIGSSDDPRAAESLADTGPGWTLMDTEPPELLDELASESLDAAELLGRRTAELHATLASDRADPAFAPEPINALYQRGVYQSMRNSTRRAIAALRRAPLGDTDAELASRVAEAEDTLLARVRRVMDVTTGMRIRIHGDLHLGQILYTGRDFTFIDFEGEPTRPLSERRIKRTPLRDVAGMLRSFDNATRGALGTLVERGAAESDALARERFGVWAATWSRWVSAAYLRGYFTTVRDRAPGIVPATAAEVDACLAAHVLDKAMYELQYELAHRPAWVSVPLSGIVDLAATA
jgi:maltose alpha-D-glucosyltransferase/alpha-amylase